MASFQDWLFGKEFLEDPTSPRFAKCTLREERLYRRKTIMFIEDLGKEMRCNERKVILTACVFFHRFFVFHSFKAQNRFNIAVACLFLASKAEEMPIKLRDIVLLYFKLRNPLENPTDMDCKDMQRNVLLAERILLQTLNFDLNITHPQLYCLMKLREFKNFIPEDKRKEVYQVTLNFVNDSYRSTLCLQYPPNQIAYGCILMATVQLSMHPVTMSSSKSSGSSAEQSWFDLLEKDVDEAAMKSICFQLMDLYDDSENSLKCEIQDKALALKNIAEITGSLTVAQTALRPSPAGVSAEEVINGAAVAVQHVAKPAPASSSSSSSGAHQSSAVVAAGEGKSEVFSYPTPVPHLRSGSVDLSPMTVSGTPSVLPPPPDTPGNPNDASGYSSDVSTFSQANRRRGDESAVRPDETPTHLPPPDTPASWATPNFDSCPRPGSSPSSSRDQSFDSASAPSTTATAERTPSEGVAGGEGQDETAPKRARLS